MLLFISFALQIWFIVNRETVVEALLFLENDSLPNSSLAGTVTTAVKKSKKKKIARVTCTLDEGHFLLNQNLEKLFSIDVQGLKFVNAHDPAAIEDSDVSINVRAARASDARRLEDHRWREIFVLPYTSTGLSARWKFYEPETSGFPGYNIHFGVESSGLQFVHLAVCSTFIFFLKTKTRIFFFFNFRKGLYGPTDILHLGFPGHAYHFVFRRRQQNYRWRLL